MHGEQGLEKTKTLLNQPKDQPQLFLPRHYPGCFFLPEMFGEPNIVSEPVADLRPLGFLKPSFKPGLDFHATAA